LIILDAGTGMRALGKALMREDLGEGKGEAVILLSHTHHDHIYGLPYFDPLYVPGNRITLYGPDAPDKSLRALVADWMAGPYHPVPLHSLKADAEFHDIDGGGVIEAGGVTVRAARVNHTTVTNAYRVEADGTAIGYVTDTGPFEGPLLLPGEARAMLDSDGSDEDVLADMRRDLVDLLQGCRLVIYDTMFDARELAECPDWGHSSAEQALDICRAANVGHLAMFHHDPDSSDGELDARLARARAMANGMQVSGAREGETLYLR